MLTKNEIDYAINLAYEATEASKVGPIFIPNPEGEGNIFATLALNTYYQVLSKILPMQANFDCTEHDVDPENKTHTAHVEAR